MANYNPLPSSPPDLLKKERTLGAAGRKTTVGGEEKKATVKFPTFFPGSQGTKGKQDEKKKNLLGLTGGQGPSFMDAAQSNNPAKGERRQIFKKRNSTTSGKDVVSGQEVKRKWRETLVRRRAPLNPCHDRN